MPVSKKRKKKQSSGPPPAKNKATAVVTPKKKKLSRQQIIIYVISGLMILSLAIGLIATGSTRQPQPTPVPQESNAILETPSPDNEQSSQPDGDTAEDAATPATTAE